MCRLPVAAATGMSDWSGVRDPEAQERINLILWNSNPGPEKGIGGPSGNCLQEILVGRHFWATS
jgi:hypothetical protein